MWDRPGRERNHTNTIQACADAGLVSAYHEWSGEAAGAETIPTLYWRDRTEIGRRFHIDYLFIPNGWRPLLRNVAIGSFAEWVGSGLSDHVPVVIDLALA